MRAPLFALSLALPFTSLAQDDVPKLYWSNEGEIHRSNLDLTNIERGLVEADLRRPNAIAVDGRNRKVYWADRHLGSIYRSDLDGSSLELFFDGDHFGLGEASTLQIDSAQNRLYVGATVNYGDYLQGNVYWVTLDLRNPDPWSYEEEDYCAFPDQLGFGVVDIALDEPRRSVFFTGIGGIISWIADVDSAEISVDAENLLFSNCFGIHGGLVRFRTGFDPVHYLDIDQERRRIYWTQSHYSDYNYTITLWRAHLRAEGGIDSTSIEKLPAEGQFSSLTVDSDGENLYWLDDGWFVRSDLDGLNVERDFIDEGAGSAVVDFSISGGKIYWTDTRGRVLSLGPEGSDMEEVFAPLVRSISSPTIDSFGGRIYWADPVARTVQRSNLDGTEIEVLASDLSWPTDVLLVDGELFWANAGGKLQKLSLDGIEDAFDVLGFSPWGSLAFHSKERRFYWTGVCSSLDNYIWSSNFDGSDLDSLFVGETQCPGEIAINESKDWIYWENESSVQIAPLDGSPVFPLFDEWDVSGNELSFAFDWEQGEMYILSLSYVPIEPYGTYSSVYKSNLDGSDLEILHQRSWMGNHEHPEFRELEYGVEISDVALYSPGQTSISSTLPSQDLFEHLSLSPPSPNPFNSSTTISYSLAAPGPVSLTVYNLLGQPVRTLVNDTQPPGSYQTVWDALDDRGDPIASGAYLIRLSIPGASHLTEQSLFIR